MPGTKPNKGTSSDGRLKGNGGAKPGPKKGSHNKPKK
jgi:hypothetical protein